MSTENIGTLLGIESRPVRSLFALESAPGIEGFVDEGALVEEAAVVGFDFEPSDPDGEKAGAEGIGVAVL